MSSSTPCDDQVVQWLRNVEAAGGAGQSGEGRRSDLPQQPWAGAASALTGGSTIPPSATASPSAAVPPPSASPISSNLPSAQVDSNPLGVSCSTASYSWVESQSGYSISEPERAEWWKDRIGHLEAQDFSYDEEEIVAQSQPPPLLPAVVQQQQQLPVPQPQQQQAQAPAQATGGAGPSGGGCRSDLPQRTRVGAAASTATAGSTTLRQAAVTEMLGRMAGTMTKLIATTTAFRRDLKSAQQQDAEEEEGGNGVVAAVSEVFKAQSARDVARARVELLRPLDL